MNKKHPTYYAFDLNNKRLPNMDRGQTNKLIAEELIFLNKSNKSVTVITEENLREFIDNKCEFCNSPYIGNLKVTHKFISSQKLNKLRKYYKIEKTQFSTLCNVCYYKLKAYTPLAFEQWVESQKHLFEDFQLRFPNARIAMLSKVEPGHGFMVIGYITVSEAEKMLEDGLGELKMNHKNGTNSLAFARYPVKQTSPHMKQNATYRKFISKSIIKKCKYCNSATKLTVDHKIPISRGGTDIENNLSIVCSRCNEDKDTMTDVEYTKYLKRKKDK